MKPWQAGLLGLAISLLLAGCASLGRQVSFPVYRPGPVTFADRSRFALLEFASSDKSLGSGYGRQFTQLLASQLSEQPRVTVADVDQVQSLLATQRFYPSRLREPAVIQELGSRLAADYLLFGDITRLTLETHGISGNRSPEAAGSVPYTEWKMIRTTQIEVQARLVHAPDAAVVWEGSIAIRRQAVTQFDGFKIIGERGSDEELIVRTLSQAGQELLAKFLPQPIMRQRVLGSVDAQTAYGCLLSAGNHCALQGNWQAAGGWWLRAAQASRPAAEAIGNLGILRERAGEYARAREDYAFAARHLGAPWNEYARQLLDTMEKK